MRFLHCGKMGDVIYSLSAVKAAGGGEVLLRAEPGFGFTQDHIEFLLPLLRQQPYILRADVWAGEEIQADLNYFRNYCPERANLADCHLMSLALPLPARDSPWLSVAEHRTCERAVVFARSCLHRGAAGFWEHCFRLLGDRAVFVGTPHEHEEFTSQVGPVRYIPTSDALELAKVIAGAELFVGNQSCPYAIAEGLKRPVILEVDPSAPNCFFARPGALQVWGTADGGKAIEAFAERFMGRDGWSQEAVGREAVIDHKTAGLLGPASLSGTSVVVLTYNSARTIEACLTSVLHTLGPEDELIVVDNASLDATRDVVQRVLAREPQARLVFSNENLGFSAGCNLGMRLSRGKTMCLLNPDTTVWPGWLEGLRKRFDDPQVGAVGPVSDNVSGGQYVGFHLPSNMQSGLTTSELQKVALNRHQDRSVLTKLLVGFCLLLRRDVMDRVGLLDEAMFLGSEDLELSWRLRTLGYRLAIARDIFVHHEGGASFQSAPSARVTEFLRASTNALSRKLGGYYAPGTVPSSEELFGCGIFVPSPKTEA